MEELDFSLCHGDGVTDEDVWDDQYIFCPYPPCGRY